MTGCFGVPAAQPLAGLDRAQSLDCPSYVQHLLSALFIRESDRSPAAALSAYKVGATARDNANQCAIGVKNARPRRTTECINVGHEVVLSFLTCVDSGPTVIEFEWDSTARIHSEQRLRLHE